MNSTSTSAPQPSNARFLTTHWSVVLSAARTDTARAEQALGRLCQTYWYPLYAYVRRRGYRPADAQDLTQAFFARLLERNWVARAEQAKGRFRSFLLGAMNHFLANEWDRLKAQKRGGGCQVLSLDAASAESRFQLEPADPVTPEKTFERRWALTLLETVFGQLQREYQNDGKGQLFSELKECLVQARAAVPYAVLAQRLNLSEGTLRVAVHRLRQRYRQLLRAEIAQTVAGPAEVDEELRYLFRVLAT